MKMSPQNPDPPSNNTAAVEDKALDKESMIELMGEDDKETSEETIELGEEPSSKDRKEKVSEEKLSEEDEDEEGLDDEELELINPPSRKEILAKYPSVFKDFPHLEKAFYREQKYAQILPTIEDAQTAADKAQLLDKYDDELMEGSTEGIMSAIRDADKEAFAKVVDNLLPVLYKVDQHSYYHTIGNVIKHTIISMVKDGREQGNQELGSAAAILNKYIFGTTNFTHPQNLSKDDVSDVSKEKESEITAREQKFAERQYNTARDDLGDRVDNILKVSVDKAIDPNGSMTDYVKRNASREVLEGLENLIMKDTRFRTIYDKLWEKAFENEFDRESMDKIKSAYLSKAKTLLPSLIKKSRNEALRGFNRSSNYERDRRGPLPVGKTRSSATLSSGKSNNSGSRKIPKGMTTLEFLNSDE
jgi:hypothetical protein